MSYQKISVLFSRFLLGVVKRIKGLENSTSDHIQNKKLHAICPQARFYQMSPNDTSVSNAHIRKQRIYFGLTLN